MPILDDKYQMVTATIINEEVTFDTAENFDEAMRAGFFRIKTSEDLSEFLSEGRLFARSFTQEPKYNQFGVLDVVNGYLQSETAQTVRFTLEEENWDKTHIQQKEVEQGESNYPKKIQALGHKMKDIGIKVLQGILKKFGVPKDLWRKATAGAENGEGSNYLLFNCYDPKLGTRPVGVGEHKDWSYITVLDAIQPGLEAFIEGEFRPLIIEDGYLIINFGEPLQKLLPGVNASLHRVVTQKAEMRTSTVMFVDPRVGSYGKTILPKLCDSAAEDEKQGYVYDWDSEQKKLTNGEPTLAYFTRLSSQLYGRNQSGVSEEQADLYSVLASFTDEEVRKKPGVPLYASLNTITHKNINIFLMPAQSQESFDFAQGLEHICHSMGLERSSKVWWVGGDLTGKFSEKMAGFAVRALRTFVQEHFLAENGDFKKDCLLLGEYAGPEDVEGKGCSAIRCVGRMLKEIPPLADNFMAYGVVTSADWFKSIKAVPHEGVKHMYVVHGNRPGNDDAWDSNALARNAIILEGGSRTLGYIFEIIANGGEVIGLYGFREKTPDYFDEESQKYCLSAAKFVSELCVNIASGAVKTNKDALEFWRKYCLDCLPYNPKASDAHTKQQFIDAAWETFIKSNLIEKISEKFLGQHYEEYIKEHTRSMRP